MNQMLIEVTRKIQYEDEYYFRIKPDEEGFRCVELTIYSETDNGNYKQGDRIIIGPKEALSVGKAIIDCANELIEQEKVKS